MEVSCYIAGVMLEPNKLSVIHNVVGWSLALRLRVT